ncbi:adenylate/guanylate cyclase domain-containing protein [Sinorhizobium sp. BG8]|uniref:adenylate/guanylate cyclase domain-containing protein n=1 Tax=Sinorhizobium sp. BG8 TaxID=2613773 RepID=UPI00193D84C5|nr:adenylate/guanylate cyclase domain-containing protein [Sinorhizobium sp. BG8]QRM56058.1 adenylate/guanylate cyclase domain-containing protein [Sinorhizobium sp. BG8]
MRPSTRYAQSGDLSIAYQVVGDGPLDLVYVPGWVSNLDHAWEFPRMVHVFNRLSSFARLILFDKRGTGLSDRNVGYPTLEQRMQDVRAVMDAAGSRRAALVGTSEGGNMCMLFAATYPERTAALVLYGCFAKGLWAPDYPWGKTRDEVEQELAMIARDWGGPFDMSNAAPTLQHDQEARNWLAGYFRNSASPQDAISLWRWNTEIDVRDILSAIHVPTLVLHRAGDRWVNVAEGRFVADRIGEARWAELPGDDHVIWAGDVDRTLDEIEEFLTGVRPAPAYERVLLTVLFTDIVGSTAVAANLGDEAWRALLKRHDDAVREELQRHGGTAVKSLGDGFLATFQGPTKAIQCAGAIRDRAAALGLDIRAALHTGECERHGGDLSGIAVHLASRLLPHAGAGEIILSRTVKDLVVGSGVTFETRGEVALRDVPGIWQLYVARIPPE